MPLNNFKNKTMYQQRITIPKHIQMLSIQNNINSHNFEIKSLTNNCVSEKLEIALSKNMVSLFDVNQYLISNKTQAISFESNSFLIYVKELEELSLLIKEDLRKSEELEINRIEKEFLTNDYEKKFNVSITTIFSSIVGEDRLYFYVRKFLGNKQKFLKSLERCRNVNIHNILK